jgi:UDP-glucose 4-epimerase
VHIAVTGAAGRLGRHVVARALRAGHEVIATDLPGTHADVGEPVQWRDADLTVLDEVRTALAGADAVVHLGGLTHPRYPEPEIHEVNVGGTHNVLVAAEELGLRAVCLASSVNAIGGIFSTAPRYDYFPIDEVHPAYCEDSYSTSKWLLEQESAAFARRRPYVPFSALRLHALCTDHLAARRLGSDEERRADLWGWTSFEAAAAACLLALHRQAPGHGVYNIVSARTASSTPSAELARYWYPELPMSNSVPVYGSFHATTKALVELGWDSRDEHPAISDGECAREIGKHVEDKERCSDPESARRRGGMAP